MKTYEGIIWTRENILPVLKQAYAEWCAADFSEHEHMVLALDTYYYQPIVGGKDGKEKHCVCKIHFIPKKNAPGFGEEMRNNPKDFLWLNGNFGNETWGCFYDDLPEEDKDKLFEILNNSEYREAQMKSAEEYNKRRKEFANAYNDICKKYGLKFQSEDSYYGLKIVEL